MYICIIIVPGGLGSGDNRTVVNAFHLCSPECSPHITQLLVEFFVVKHHLRDGVIFLLEQLWQRSKYAEGWHSACTLTEDVPSYLVQNWWCNMTYAAFTGTLVTLCWLDLATSMGQWQNCLSPSRAPCDEARSGSALQGKQSWIHEGVECVWSEMKANKQLTKKKNWASLNCNELLIAFRWISV